MSGYVDPQSVDNPTPGGTIQAAWGDTVRDSLQALAAPPFCRVGRTGNQAIPNATASAMLWDSELQDSHNIHSTSVNTRRITVPSGWGGVWKIEGNVGWQALNTGRREIAIRLNGTLFIAINSDTPASGGECNGFIETEWEAVAGDYFDLVVTQDTGGNLDIVNFDYTLHFAARWVRLPSSIAG